MNYNLNGLYVITDKKLIPKENFIEVIESVLRGGANVVQLREKGTSENEVISIGKRLIKLTKKYKVPLIINDSPKIAKIVGADGVHLGIDDADIEFARNVLGDGKIIGVSCYGDIDRAKNAVEKGADYLAFGTPYSTPTKPERKPTPIETLLEARKVLNKIPIFAIGGINPVNAKVILDTGVDGIAVITSVFGSENPEESSRKLSNLFD